jgi:hypothetical protein
MWQYMYIFFDRTNVRSNLLLLGHLPNLVGHCPMSDSNLQPCKGVAMICTIQKLPRRKLCRTKVNNWCSQLETWHKLQLTPLLQLTVATNIVNFLVYLVFKDPITLKNFQKHCSCYVKSLQYTYCGLYMNNSCVIHRDRCEQVIS